MHKNELDMLLKQMRDDPPRVHCLTNSVVQNLTANVLLSVGSIPSMTIDPDEVGDFTASANSLLVNLGTLDATRKEAILKAIHVANEQNIPWILDPVLINRAPKRLDFAKDLLKLKPALIRANAQEMTAFDLSVTELLNETSGVIAITGKVDEVYRLNEHQEIQTLEIKGGHELMAHVTGLGCAGTAVLAALIGVGEEVFDATCAGLNLLGHAGEKAGEKAIGPASFETAFMDQLYTYYKGGFA